MIRGVPEVPFGIADPELRRFLIDLRENVLAVRQSQTPPATPTNVKVTAQPFGNIVQWTRGKNSDFHEVLVSSTPNMANAVVIGVGNSPQYVDNIGQQGVKRWYWVRSHKFTGSRSVEVATGPSTTLASNAGVTPPTPPPASQLNAQNQRTGHLDPRTQTNRVSGN